MKKSLAKIGLIAAGIAMLGTPAASIARTSSASAKASTRDAVKNDETPTRPVMQRNAHGGFGNHSMKTAGLFLNQRQYRKRCRQNPRLLRSKKHRSKN